MQGKGNVTALELKILKCMWASGAGAHAGVTVTGILSRWESAERPGYTTILKKLQVMESKGLVRHKKQGRAYAYIPRVSKEQVSAHRVRDLLTSVFSGDTLELAHAFIKEADLSADEIAELKKMIARKEQEVRDAHG